MKSRDALIAAWEETLARKGDAAAIFDTRGAVSLTFREIEEQARMFEQKFGASRSGARECNPNRQSSRLAGNVHRVIAQATARASTG